MLKKLLRKIRFGESYIEPALCIAEPDQFLWDNTADVVVVGFGGAGAAAAIEAREQGLSVLALDRFNGGGATTISGGVYYAGGGTHIQQDCGMEDSVDNMFNYLKFEVQGAVSDETLRTFCQQSVDNFNWISQHGVPFETSFCPFKTSYPPDHFYFYYSGNESFSPYSDYATPVARGHRAHRPGISGQAIFEPLRKAARRAGVTLQTQTKVVGILTNTQGAIIGVKAVQLDNIFFNLLHRFFGKAHMLSRYMALYTPSLFRIFGKITETIELNFGSACYIRANQGVILATGGFYANQVMVEQYASDYVGGSPLGTLADDGTGIRLAQQLGAKTACMDNISSWRFINPPSAFASSVMVGPSGHRVCNEMLYGAQIGERIMRDHDGKAWLIIDQQLYQQAHKDLTLEKGLWFHVMLGWMYLHMGYKKAQSLQELASKLRIHPKNLEDTIHSYNAIANSEQQDPMGKPKDYVKALNSNGPYYAIDVSYHYFWVPATSLSLGGLVVNEKTGQVKNANGEDMQGLYAAGRTAVGIPSRGYVSGLSIADCVFSGRRAARHIATKAG